MDSRRRTRVIRITVWAAVLGLLLGVLSSLALAAGADAHAALTSISPADGARLTAAPRRVVLTFDEPIGKTFATVIVTNGAGASVSQGRAVVDGAVVTQNLTPGLASGAYAVSFRVVSDDGHPVSDRTTFTIALPAGAAGPATGPATRAATASSTPSLTTPTSDPSQGTTASGAASGTSTSMRIGLAVGVAALALAVGTALVAASRRGRAA